jgi:uncharacterized metal-binding protein YceD (DUF177 family)
MAVDRLGAATEIREIAATAEERTALAGRFALLALDRLEATLRIERLPAKTLIRLSGRLSADVTQACVVSLEPVASQVQAEISQLYTLDPEVAVPREHVIDVAAEDPPEPIGPGGLDLGEAVAQNLAVALDPYPRASEAEAAAASPAAEAETAPVGPFAALAALKRR